MKSSKFLGIAYLVSHALSVFGFITVEVFELNPGIIHLVFFVALLGIGFVAGGVLLYRFLRSLWHTHCAISLFFETHIPGAPKRLIDVLNKEPYKITNSHITVEYLDPGGERVKITKIQHIEVLAEDINELWDRNIGVDPKEPGADVVVSSFKCSLGTVVTPVSTEGQSYNVCSRLPEKYPRGAKFPRELTYEVVNSYCNEEENFVLTGGKLVDHTTVVVKVPPPAHIHQPRVIYAPAGHRIPFHDSAPARTSPDFQSLTWDVDKAFIGEKFILYWRVAVNATPVNHTNNSGKHGKPNKNGKKKKGGQQITMKKHGEVSAATPPAAVGQKSADDEIDL